MTVEALPSKQMVRLFSRLMTAAWWILEALTPISRRIARLVASKRAPDASQLQALALQRAQCSRAYLIFCSSAGEYEQAHPLIERLKGKDQLVAVVFFSESGFNFAEKRGEDTPFFRSPWDTLKNWRAFFSALRPHCSVVVRHELWPCFLQVAKEHGSVHLINASLSADSLPKRMLSRQLLKFFDCIYPVSPERHSYLLELGIAGEKLVLCGDTKYDRVFKNAMTHKTIPLEDRPHRFIVGSAWHQDALVALDAFVALKDKLDLQLIIAPHEPSREFLCFLDTEAKKRGLSLGRYSQLKSVFTPNKCIVIDAIGILNNIYALCHFALVGGGLHHKVHNVLEPAAFGLPVCFGKYFTNSHEAVSLLEQELATVISSSADLQAWLLACLRQKIPDPKLLSFVKQHAGAVDRLVSSIDAHSCKTARSSGHSGFA